MPFQSVFARTFDAVVFGAGYAGFAAARSLKASGKSVLLVDRIPAPLWESSWAFSTQTGESSSPLWRELTDSLKAKQAFGKGLIDGAIAEVVTSKLLGQGKIEVLYYATPIAAHVSSGALQGVAVGLKEGVRVIESRQWIDATDTGELMSLLGVASAPTPKSRRLELFFRLVRPVAGDGRAIACPALAGATLKWHPTLWDNQWALTVDLPSSIGGPERLTWLPALEALRAQAGDELKQAVLSHASVVPFTAYAPAPVAARKVGNVATAVPALAGHAVETLASRFDLGLAAAVELAKLESVAEPSVPHGFGETIEHARPMAASVAVAGTGTGGTLAALAAAKQGAKVVAFDHLPYAGGIGSGGGIHWYYFGVKGGLQEELDERTRRLTPLFGDIKQVHGFHPDARKLANALSLHEAGVTFLPNTTTFGVEKRGGQITHAMLATTSGPVKLAAPAWIDSTGDGDLSARGGASFILGRPHDGQLHAYSVSSGLVGLEGELPHMRVVNFDAGFVDATNSEDLTRARLVGVNHYDQDVYAPVERPTYIAPAIGLRQSRHIDTRYCLTLHDLVERRTFKDVVGYTGCHYDNHAVDYEFESDEAMYWVWVCRAWRNRVSCEFPYRLLLPKGLDNVWVACRAIGVSIEAHHSLRMQRDMQRLGEIAGIAAAIAVRRGVNAPEVPYAELRQALEASGALAKSALPHDQFGPSMTPDEALSASQTQLPQWIEEMVKGPGEHLYLLVKAGAAALPLVRPHLASADEGLSFRAASIFAMADDAAAEPRMIRAIENRENGFDPESKEPRPETNNRVVHHWVVAITLLRRCGTPACLATLEKLASDKSLLHNVRTSIAITCKAIASRFKLSAAEKASVAKTLALLVATPAPNSAGSPQRKPMVEDKGYVAPPTSRKHTTDDFTWQIHLAVAQAEATIGLPIHAAAKQYLGDPRAIVRRAFGTLLQQY